MDFTAIGEIRDMKLKINKDVELKGRTNRDVKLGYGGIREVEFVIQALQLIYGGRDRALREKNAMKALHALSQKGLISYQEHEDLARPIPSSGWSSTGYRSWTICSHRPFLR